MTNYSITENIKARTSWRTYIDTPIDDETREKLLTFIDENTSTPFNSKIRFEIVDNHIQGRQRLGTYGFIKGAPSYLVGAVKDSPMNLEDFGYLMEKHILYATHLGLGTCWLGGTFTKSNFSHAIQLQSDETLPALTPIGHTPGERRIVAKVMRWAVGARQRKPWSELFFNKDFVPLSEKDAGNYAIALEMVRLGPSASNKQSWRLVVEEEEVHFFSQSQNLLSNLQRIDMGIAMCHFHLTLNEQGIEGKWMKKEPRFDHPDSLVFVVSWKIL